MTNPETVPYALDLSAEELRTLVTRLRRAQGQLGGVATMLEDGRDCREVVTQLQAAKKAIDRTGYLLFQAALRTCLVNPAHDEAEVKRIEKLFLTLS
ncbi:MAG TPA: metal-sensitive transcriptional regulator [Propionibacterium sp.]|nr:metal-sensitive transcriptional regulator [Propionibacterium sp.]